jgi:serine protease AprX
MQKLFIIALLLILPLSLFSQKLSDGTYWISFSDKAGENFSLSDPEKFLSQRSLVRRARQNISLSMEDLPVSKIYLDSLKNLGLTILGSSRWFNSVIVESYDTLLLDSLDHISFVSEFHFKIPRKKTLPIILTQKKSALPNEEQQVNKYDYGLAYPQIALINGNSLHNLGYRGSGFRIAVIDGGFFNADSIAAFDSLWNEGRLLDYRDFSRSGTDFFNTASHGMSVLSTMAANLPGEIIGTAPKASYYLLKSEIVESETPLEEALWVLAAEFADSVGADIITSSLGYSQFDDPEMNYTYTDMDGKTTLVTRAAEKAFSKGMVVVISAGNEGNKTWKYITAPSDGKNVLAVGATDTSGNVVTFSSRGPSSDNRVKPDILAIGYKTFIINSLGYLGWGYGTSFSAPQVAGMIACLWEAAPEKTNLEIIQSVRRSASLYLSPDDSAGYGIPDFLTALSLLTSAGPAIPSDRLLIVPNPNPGDFEIRSGNIAFGEIRISIYNLTGKKIYAGTKTFAAGFARINEMAGQSPGMYLIVAESEGKKYFSNVIILR